MIRQWEFERELNLRRSLARFAYRSPQELQQTLRRLCRQVQISQQKRLRHQSHLIHQDKLLHEALQHTRAHRDRVLVLQQELESKKHSFQQHDADIRAQLNLQTQTRMALETRLQKQTHLLEFATIEHQRITTTLETRINELTSKLCTAQADSSLDLAHLKRSHLQESNEFKSVVQQLEGKLADLRNTQQQATDVSDQELQQLRNQCQKSQEEMQALQDRIVHLVRELKENERSRSELSSKLQQVEVDIRVGAEQYQSLRKSAVDSEAVQTIAVSKLNAEYTKLAGEVSRLNHALHEEQMLANTSHQRVVELETVQAEQARELEQERKRGALLVTELAEREHAIQLLTQEAVEARKETLGLRARTISLSEQLTTRDRAIDQLQQKLQELQNVVASQQTHEGSIQTKLIELEDANKRLFDDNANASASARQSSDAMHAQLQSLLQDNRSARTAFDVLQASLHTAELEIERLSASIKDTAGAKAESTALGEQYASLTAQHAKTVTEKQGLEERIIQFENFMATNGGQATQKLEQQLAETRLKFAQALSDKDDIESDLNDTRQEVEQLKEEIIELRQRLPAEPDGQENAPPILAPTISSNGSPPPMQRVGSNSSVSKEGSVAGGSSTKSFFAMFKRR